MQAARGTALIETTGADESEKDGTEPGDETTRESGDTGDDRSVHDRMGPGGRRRLLALVVSAAVVVWVLDQVTKLMAVDKLTGRAPIELLGGLLNLRLVKNTGAAFGLAAGYTIVLTLLASGVVVFVIVLSRKLASLPWALAFGLLLGGALGNLTDRMRNPPGPLRGYVVDFLELPRWPVFNLADTAICCAAVLIVILSLTGRQLDGTRHQRQA